MLSNAMFLTGIYPEEWESISVKGGVLSRTELQQMCYKALPQATCYFCTLSQLIGFSHLCEISMFFFLFFLLLVLCTSIKISHIWPKVCVSDRNISFVPS